MQTEKTETELEEIIAFLAGRLDQETTNRFVKELEDPDSRLSRVLQGARDAEQRFLDQNPADINEALRNSRRFRLLLSDAVRGEETAKEKVSIIICLVVRGMAELFVKGELVAPSNRTLVQKLQRQLLGDAALDSVHGRLFYRIAAGAIADLFVALAASDKLTEVTSPPETLMDAQSELSTIVHSVAERRASLQRRERFEQLACDDSRRAEVYALVHFAGRTYREVAELLNESETSNCQLDFELAYMTVECTE